MTLKQWEKQYGNKSQLKENGTRYVLQNCDNSKAYRALCDLYDYKVLSVAAGVVWLRWSAMRIYIEGI